MKPKVIKFIAVGIVALLFSSGVIHAEPEAPGDLDSGFGNGGKVTTDIAGSGDSANGVVIQTDGKIVAVGNASQQDFCLVRYNADGSLDTTFGSGGKVATDISGSTDSARAVAIQADGKFVLAGRGGVDFGLARYNTNGSLDTSFGTGGKVTTDFSAHDDQANSIALQADGKIVVAGQSDTTGSFTEIFALARYNTNGSLDTSFGTGGKVTTAFASTSSVASGVAVQADGEIVVAGYTFRDFAMARYDTNGGLDPTFGSGGKVTTDLFGFSDFANAIAIQDDGQIVLAGYAGTASGLGHADFALARYDKVGSLDLSFGSGGKAIADFLGDNDFGSSMGIQKDGKIVMAGPVKPVGISNDDFGLARFNADGSLDTTFGSAGKVTTDFLGVLDEANGMVIQADGKIVAAGYTANSLGGGDFALARYQAAPPTVITLASFNATTYDTGVYLEWQTGLEADNLGFNIYRDEGGKLTPVNQQLVAGSALRASSTLRSGETYGWWDESKGKDALYWLEDLDLNGQSTWHGPFSIKQASGVPPSRSPAALLSKLGNQQSEGDATRVVERVATVSRATAGQDQAQTWLARQRAVKIFVKREGWYHLSQPELLSAGLPKDPDARFLQLFADGREVPIIVNPGKDGRFDDSASIEFYGLGIDTPSTDARTYWLTVGSQQGKRIQVKRGEGVSSISTSFPQTVERRDRSLYFAALLNGDKENFFGAVVASSPVDLSLTLRHLATTQEAATLDLSLQGVTLQTHRVLVQLNGASLGEVVSGGQQNQSARFPVPASLLREGANTVRLLAQNGAADVSLVDTLRISYAHSYTADDDLLKFTTQGREAVTVGGFTSKAIRVFDVTDDYNVRELIGEVSQSKGGFAVAVTPPDLGRRTLIALTEEKSKSPVPLEANRPSNWRSPANAADFVIIMSPELRAAIQPLLDLKRTEGYQTALVAAEDIYDEFNFGHKSPQSIRDFLSYANTNWRMRPQFLMFVGDASYDPKNYLGLGDNDVVPTKLIDTSFLETASDDWFADFDDDGISDVAIGRLPVHNVEETAIIVSKLVRYSRSEPSESALLVSDANDGFNFEQASAHLRPLFPSSLKVEELKRGELDPVTAKRRLLEAINRGQKFVNYVGHGSLNQWRGDLLTSADAGTLTNEARLPIFVVMTCLNGYFAEAGSPSLAEALVKAPNGGAVAAWASSGMTLPDAQAAVNQSFYRLLLQDGLLNVQDLTLGEAVRQAKLATADLNVRRTWVLLGDPSMRLR